MTYKEIWHRWTSGDLGLAPTPPYFEVKAFEVLHNLNDRLGYQHLWDQLDGEIREEIFKSITTILESRDVKLEWGYRSSPS